MVLGLLLNFYRLTFLIDFQLVFGPFCSLIVARYLGLKTALIFSAVISLPLLNSWLPSLIILHVLEAGFIAHITAKGKRNILYANIIYWFLIGIPIAWLTSQFSTELNPVFQSIYLAALLLNAILYSLLATIVINFPWIKSNLSGHTQPVFMTLRQKTAHHISVIFSLFMSVVLMFYFYQQVNNLERSTKRNLSLVHSKIHTEINHRMSTFTQVFSEKKHLFQTVWQQRNKVNQQLKNLHKRFPDFVSMLVADNQGNILSFSLSGIDENTVTLFNIKDRTYFKKAIANEEVYVSSGFQGKGFGQDLIIAISVSIIDEQSNEPLGILEGSLKLSAITKMTDDWQSHKPTVNIITDQENQTIISNINGGNDALDKVTSHQSSHSLFSLPLYYQKDPSSLFIKQQSAFSWGWQFSTMMNQTEIASSLKHSMLFVLMVLIGCILISQWLAWILSKSWTHQITQLSQWVSKQNNQLLEIEDEFHPKSSEIKLLYDDLKHSRKQYLLLNQELENKVVEQTAKLFEINQKLEIQALTDSLTQLANRRSFDKKLNEIWNNMDNKEVTLHLIDIDHFKNINDKYGHPIGDMVLQYTAQCLNELTNESDHFASRIGGEEFAIVSCNSENAQSFQLAEDLINKLNNHTHSFDKHPIKYTVSIGIAKVNRREHDIKQLYHSADQALYQAKKAGRNQYRVFKTT